MTAIVLTLDVLKTGGTTGLDLVQLHTLIKNYDISKFKEYLDKSCGIDVK